MPQRYQAELAPIPRLIADRAPPLATRLWLISETGIGFAGHWYPECRAVAWCPLPKLAPAQKTRLAALRASGQDPTQPPAP